MRERFKVRFFLVSSSGAISDLQDTPVLTKTNFCGRLNSMRWRDFLSKKLDTLAIINVRVEKDKK